VAARLAELEAGRRQAELDGAPVGAGDRAFDEAVLDQLIDGSGQGGAVDRARPSK
jgi:hypothetical protein